MCLLIVSFSFLRFSVFETREMLTEIGPYGTGNMSFGNFDFDPEFYPDPKGFIENLTAAGFDFQVRIFLLPSYLSIPATSH